MKQSQTPICDAREFTINGVKGVPSAVARQLEIDRGIWLYNAQQLQIQQNGWEPERAKLKAELVKLKAELTMVNHVKAISV
jgi:hypothetical protein